MIKKSISVRELVEFTFVHEDITPSSNSEAMLAGTLSHQARQSKLDDNYISEYSIISSFVYDDYELGIIGRMDAFCDSISCATIEEIKLCNKDDPPKEPLPRHIWQAYTYAAMLYNNRPDQKCIEVVLNYCDKEGNVCSSFKEKLSREHANDLIYELIVPYVNFLHQEAEHLLKRDESISELTFPFSDFRPGQRDMAAQVYTTIRLKKKLYASLPTGTGKTMASIFPAVKAMEQGYCNKIMYLTARTSARQAPINAVKLLLNNGISLRSLVISAKEKACIHDMDCDPNKCPFAKGHFVREKSAIQEILNEKIWDFETIHRVSINNNICPFEFSLSLYYLADIVICDYNYIFDPFVKLIRAEQDKHGISLLVDEAHQLIPRLRESLSSCIDTEIIKKWNKEIANVLKKNNVLHKQLKHLISEIKSLSDTKQKDLRLLEIPEHISAICENIKYSCADFFMYEKDTVKSELGETVGEVYKCINSFLFGIENAKSAYKIIYNSDNKNASLQLICIDPRFQILQSINSLSGSVFFSATLAPLSKMKIILGGGNDDATFSLPSPFPKENLLILRSNTSTYYTDREKTLNSIASLIVELVNSHKGNYIVYLPSYEYLDMMKFELENLNADNLLVQSRNMSDSEKNDFINKFKPNSNILALCVMGGSFSEGIDLPGKLLYGAIIVGVGLQKPDIKSELIMEYFDEKYSLGYEYAYLYPAIQRILQASGRVIRSETDKGIIMLIDKRYFSKKYTNLLPTDWKFVDKNYTEALKSFNSQ